MKRVDSKNDWKYYCGFNKAIDFCIWLLQVEGLHMYPFTSHILQNQNIKKLDLKENDWKIWLSSVVRVQNEQMRVFQQRKDGPLDLLQADWSQLLLSEASNPSILWEGDEGTKKLIDRYWEQYNQSQIKRSSWVPEFQIEMARGFRGGVSHKIWRSLQAYRTSLEMFSVYLVEYPHAIAYSVPPYTAIISVGNGSIEKKTFYEHVLSSAKELANK